MAMLDRPLLNAPVKEFDALKLRINGHQSAFTLRQGSEPSVVIRGPDKPLSRVTARVTEGCLRIELGGGLSDRISDAFATGPSRQRIEIDLTTPKLHQLDLGGFIEGRISDLDVKQLDLTFTGLGHLEVGRLQCEFLSSTLKGSPAVQISGAVDEQHVTVRGIGQYRAGGLETQRTKINMSGSGFSTLWVEQALDIEIQGMGSIEYYGRPTIKRRTVGMNNLKALGSRQPAQRLAEPA